MACHSVGSPAPQQVTRGASVTLGFDEGAVFDGRLHVVFAGIVEDSRCPQDVECFWQGQVVVRLAISLGDARSNSHDVIAGQPLALDSYQLSVLEVHPHPTSGRKIPREEYRIVLKAE